jgi:hypothetical protein
MINYYIYHIMGLFLGGVMEGIERRDEGTEGS